MTDHIWDRARQKQLIRRPTPTGSLVLTEEEIQKLSVVNTRLNYFVLQLEKQSAVIISHGCENGSFHLLIGNITEEAIERITKAFDKVQKPRLEKRWLTGLLTQYYGINRSSIYGFNSTWIGDPTPERREDYIRELVDIWENLETGFGPLPEIMLAE